MSLQRSAISVVHMWSAHRRGMRLARNAFLIETAGGLVAFDPIEPDDDTAARIRAMGGVRGVAWSGPAREAEARAFAMRFGAEPVALVAGEPIEGCEAIRIRCGSKGVEFALHLPAGKAAIVGGALVGDPAGGIRMPDDWKASDEADTALGLRALWALKLDALLVGEGACIFGDADRVIGAFLQSRSDVYVNRINFDEIEPRTFGDPGGKFGASVKEAGLPIGARRLGYHLVTLAPGMRFCPLHSHALEEEMFLVWEGRPTVRTPRGEYECKRGDVICFPVGDIGAHQLLNKSDAPATVFMLGNMEPEEVAHYPDSNKVLIRSRQRLILRAEPRLDYFDGE